jgi:hypothetical protein
VLYCDRDSVIYIEKVDEAPKVGTGNYLGDLTDEVEDFGSGDRGQRNSYRAVPRTMDLLSSALPQRNVHLNIK